MMKFDKSTDTRVKTTTRWRPKDWKSGFEVIISTHSKGGGLLNLRKIYNDGIVGEISMWADDAEGLCALISAAASDWKGGGGDE